MINTRIIPFLLMLLLLFGDKSTAQPKRIYEHQGMEFILVKSGKFMMGSIDRPETILENGGGRIDEHTREHPRHLIEIRKDFYLSTKEVTVGQFALFVKDTGFITKAELDGYSWVWDKKWKKVNGADWKRPSGLSNHYKKIKDHPVVHISWFDAFEFCRWLSKKDEKYYRLPTEAEWEYACRAGTNSPFFFGKTISTNQANFDGRFTYDKGVKGVYIKSTTPVGSYAQNSWGLFDMHGNVWEWCADWFGEKYYQNSPVINPKGPPEGTYKVIRGGSWYNYPRILRCATRFGKRPYCQDDNLGFRVALDYQ